MVSWFPLAQVSHWWCVMWPGALSHCFSILSCHGYKFFTHPTISCMLMSLLLRVPRNFLSSITVKPFPKLFQVPGGVKSWPFGHSIFHQYLSSVCFLSRAWFTDFSGSSADLIDRQNVLVLSSLFWNSGTFVSSQVTVRPGSLWA